MLFHVPGPSMTQNLCDINPIPQKSSSMSSQLGAVHSSRGVNSDGVSREFRWTHV